jgi:predicted helicase
VFKVLKEVRKGDELKAEALTTLTTLSSLEIEKEETLTIIIEGPPESASASDASGLNPNISYSGSSLYGISKFYACTSVAAVNMSSI